MLTGFRSVDILKASCNLVRPRIQRHTIGREKQVRLGLFNIRSVGNKTNDVRELFDIHYFDAIVLNETRREDADCVAIKRLQTLELNFVEAARLIPAKANNDNISYVNWAEWRSSRDQELPSPRST